MSKFSKRMNRQMVMLIIVASFVSFALVLNTLAWLRKDFRRPHSLRTTSVEIHPDVYFLKSDGTRIPGSTYRESDTTYYKINLDDPRADNYLSKLRVDIRYMGMTYSYVRVYIAEMGVIVGYDSNTHETYETIYIKEETDYTFNSNWLDNRLYDKYVYFTANNAEAGKGAMNSLTENAFRTFNFITGVNNVLAVDDGAMYLAIRAEAVQINRLEAFWGITQNDYDTLINS